MFNIVLAVIAPISLLVGGIGIMNVMLATVTERTREIGIRRALGAKKKHIIQQFLVEAGVLSALGGIVGVIVGVVLPTVITNVFEQRTDVMPQHVALAFGISAAVGVSFGIYPAWRAANMDPVEALRHE
jgi:putative ABC transport system permease protein